MQPMFIDFFRYVVMHMPTRWRLPLVLELFRVLVAKPMQGLFAEFSAWRSGVAYRATITPQVCSLEEAAKRLLDANIRITDLDGKPYDFLVTVYGGTDVSKLSALLNTYKLAGRSYIYELGDTVYSCRFTNHVNEDIVELYTCKFVEHVEEDDAIVRIRLFVGENNISNNIIVEALADRPVNSNVTINGKLLSRIGGQLRIWTQFSVEINSGQTSATADMGMIIEAYWQLEVTSLSPTSDTKYTYTIID